MLYSVFVLFYILYSIMYTYIVCTVLVRKVLEGHDSSVLRVEFVNEGTQLLSSGSDGLLKLWHLTRSSSSSKRSSDDSSSAQPQLAKKSNFAKRKSTSGSGPAPGPDASFAGECIRTYDEHAGKLWALAATGASSAVDAAGGEDGSSGGEAESGRGIRVATGGADATLVLWKDVTIAEQREKLDRQKELIEQYTQDY